MKNKNVQTEIDACYLYRKLAEHESDEIVADVFRQMSEIEQGHAEAFARSLNIPTENLIQPSWRAKTLVLIGTIFGYICVNNMLYNIYLFFSIVFDPKAAVFYCF